MPALPYVTAAARGEEVREKLRAGLQAAGADPRLAAARADLMLSGFVASDASAYAPVAEADRSAPGLAIG